ncbi:HTH-type transcriptional regulator AdhR [compost metagenome]
MKLELEQELSISQVAERTGISAHSLRFYEREGLMLSPRISRDGGGRRRYKQADVEWLGLCIKFRASGMPIAQIRRYAELVRQGMGNEQERLAILREHQQRTVSQIAQLNDCLELISRKVDTYEQHLRAGTAQQLWSVETT